MLVWFNKKRTIKVLTKTIILGGLLREWYQVITREIFNPNYALFINAPGDRVTYMINKSSNVNPEHLEYFQVYFSYSRQFY